jgi:lysozyme
MSTNSLDPAVNLVTEFEGFSSSPYQDPVGIWTIGYGSIRDSRGFAVTADTPAITEAEARALVSRDLQSAARTLQAAVTVPLTDNEHTALEDFIYNLGSGNFASSTLLRKLNAGDYAGAANQLDLWDHAGGKVLAGLLRRRQAETKLFNT